jgi:hypothetical protein
MKKKKEVKKIPYIDYMCKVGERVQWLNLAGVKFEGVIMSWNENVATVKLHSLDSNEEIEVVC